MTRIDFHSNVGDLCAHACRLLRKASAQGARLLVLAESPLLEQIDQSLWAMGDSEFIAHCQSQDPQELLDASPIVLHAQAAAGPLPLTAATILVNLSRWLPQDYERFERLIEILPRPEQDAQAVALGRQRWQHYKRQGHELSNHALS